MTTEEFISVLEDTGELFELFDELSRKNIWNSDKFRSKLEEVADFDGISLEDIDEYDFDKMQGYFKMYKKGLL